MKKIYKLIIGVSIPAMMIILFFNIHSAVGAELILAGENDARTGDELELKLVVNSDEAINAVEGVIKFPQNNLELKDIRVSGSLLNLWVEEPEERSPGEINFVGIIPGGWQGKAGILFVMTFQIKEAGLFNLTAESVRILKHDGRGTPVDVSLRPLEVAVFRKTEDTGGAGGGAMAVRDTEAPESFVPQIIKNELFHDGRATAVFFTDDKGVGVDHYEIKEVKYKFLSFLTGYKKAVSPYELEDQGLSKYLYIKVVDKDGNVRVVVTEPENRQAWYHRIEVWCIITVGTIILILALRKLWRIFWP